VLLYGAAVVGALLLLQRGFRTNNRVHFLVLLAAFACHTTAMTLRGLAYERCPTNTIYEATVFFSWFMAAASLTLSRWPKSKFLGAFASPVLLGLGVFALMPGLDPPHGETPIYTNGWIRLHASLVLLAYGAFGLAAAGGLMYLRQERDLKKNKLRAILSRLPSLQRLELQAAWLLVIGLALLTLGLFIGGTRIPLPTGKSFAGDPKVAWSMVVWLMYAGLLAAYWRWHQRGRRLAWGAVGLFAFVALTFWGFNLLSGVHQP
jgi:ABC-type uncharacterized transport system permease subunit